MTDKLHQDAARGKRAEQLVNDELLTGAFTTLRADYIKAWEETGARDTDARERLWQAIQIVGKVQTHLKSVLNDGKLAMHELNAIKR
jgi:hypothetical protein